MYDFQGWSSGGECRASAARLVEREQRTNSHRDVVSNNRSMVDCLLAMFFLSSDTPARLLFGLRDHGPRELAYSGPAVFPLTDRKLVAQLVALSIMAPTKYE